MGLKIDNYNRSPYSISFSVDVEGINLDIKVEYLLGGDIAITDYEQKLANVDEDYIFLINSFVDSCIRILQLND